MDEDATEEAWHSGGLGCVTGRFQPPHQGHLELIELVASRHGSIIIGVTNADPTHRRSDAANPDRHLASSNPLTYFERMVLLRALMESRSIDPHRFMIVPFPLSEPNECSHYVPRDTLQYVRVYSPWELRKVELLRGSGYQVHVIQPRTPKQWSAATIRKAMLAGSEWREMVPSSTLRSLDEFLKQRPMQERN